MKKLYILFAFALLATTTIEAQTISVTYRVTLKGTGKRLHPDSLRVTGNFGANEQSNWSPSTAKKMVRAANFATDSIYTITLTYANRSTMGTDTAFFYKFINGADWGDGANGGSEDERGLTATCAKAAGSDRVWKMPATGTSFILPAYRFNTCTVVFATSSNEVSTVRYAEIVPNPMTDVATLVFENPTNEMHSVEIVSLTGQVVRTIPATNAENIAIERNDLSAGMYFARIRNTKGESQTMKFTIQ